MDIWILMFIGILNFVVISLFALTGGIGLVMRPIMMFLGYSPDIVIGTARVSAIPGSILSQWMLHKSKKIDWNLVLMLAPMNIVGGIFGIYVVVSLDDLLLKKVIGISLLFAGFVFLFNKKLGIKKSKPKFGKFHILISWPFMFVFGTLLVIIGGVGPLARLLLIFGYGKTHIEAAAIQKAINFWQTIITSVIFVVMLMIDWKLLMVLMISAALGQYVGTRFVLKRGEKYLKVLLLFVIFISAIKLLFF